MRLLFLLLFSAMIHEVRCQEISLEKTGKPVYRKQANNDLGIVVYKKGSASVATILPREYFVLGDYNDTLELEIVTDKNAKAGFTASCTNCTSIRFEQLEEAGGSRFRLSDGEDEVLFNITYEKAPSGLRIAPRETPLPRDTEIGYIRLQNTLIRYNAIPGKPGFNIAIADMNHNGRADSSDFISLSTDAFFYTARRDRSKQIGEVRTIAVDGQLYSWKLTGPKNFRLQLTPLASAAAPDLMIATTLENLRFGATNLYALLDSAGQVLITHWTEYSKPCTLALSDVSELSETIPVVALHTGNKDLDYINRRYEIGYISIQSTEELENKLNLSGYPHYIIVGRNREILLDTSEIGEVKSFLEK